MNSEAAAANRFASQSSSASILLPQEKRRTTQLRTIPSLSGCIFILILCIFFGEVFEGAVLHGLAPHLSHTGVVVIVDVILLVVIIIPAFIFLVYRPMKQYGQDKLASEEEIKFLSRQLILSGDRERRDVARALHDQFGQSLTALQFSIETLKISFDDKHPEQKAQCENLSETISHLGDMVQNISTRLSPFQLEDLGLVPTLEWAIRDIQNKDVRFSLDFDVEGMDDRLPYDIEIALYRIFQESMSNISKHSEATKVKIFLVGMQSQVRMSIQDNGIGFGYTKSGTGENNCLGIGLLGIRERVEDLGGGFSLRTTSGQGTEIQVSVPRSLKRKDDHQM